MLTKLIEIFQIGAERAGILDIPEKYWPDPGQYLACKRVNNSSEPLTNQLFRIIGEEGLLSLGPIPDHWQPGDQLLVGVPQGHGFSLPGEVRRVALFPYKVSPIRLLTLVRGALAQNASISLFSETIPSPEVMSRMPSVVEVNPTTALLENLDWPDFLAADVARDELQEFFGLFNEEVSHLNGQVLIRTPMPCRGIGDCGVCAVDTWRGLRFACVDGPVFSLKELRHVV